MSSVTTSGATRSTFSFARIWDQFGMLVVFAVLFIGCVIFVPNFASFVNMKGLGAGDLDVRDGGLRHAVLPGLRRF
ncbi:L-arabinose transporter permease protein [Klebsiella pneumoniae subsp. ozaenae]|uniref:L-arabinose transporter permease protein n=1 Tax=Klebsiella pneumoniae subsp. ozaenae TaxID=574 RepID=A0A377ZFA9_KLEPO|nr:L-arabinose transporter permease protein [Klebsiella pneumoniae subsp. ozaenae]